LLPPEVLNELIHPVHLCSRIHQRKFYANASEEFLIFYGFGTQMRNWNKVKPYSNLMSWQRKVERYDKSIVELNNRSRKWHERFIAHTSFGFLSMF